MLIESEVSLISAGTELSRVFGLKEQFIQFIQFVQDIAQLGKFWRLETI